MLKIYYVANARMPSERAHGIQLAKMCEAFSLSGLEYVLVLPKRQNVLKSCKDYDKLDPDLPEKRLPVLDMYLLGKIGFVLSSASFMVSSFFYLLWKKVRGEKFVVYTIDMDQFSFLLLPLLFVPYFMEIHDAKERKWTYRWLFWRVSGVVTINNLIKEKLAETFSISRSRIIVHPNGIDLQFFNVDGGRVEAFRRSKGLPIDKKVVLYSGKFHKWKGMQILTEAAGKASPDIVFYVVGSTEGELKSASYGKQIPKNVVCLGTRPYEEMPLWMSVANASVVLGTKENQYSYYYTSPMKLFEYMAAKRPVIAGNTPAIRQIVTEGQVLFYEPDDTESLVKAVERAVREDNFQRTESAYNLVQGFSWKKRAESVKEFISSISSLPGGKTVGIFLHPFDEDAPAGLSRFILLLTKSLIESDRTRDYVVFLKKAPKNPLPITSENFRVYYERGQRGWMRSAVKYGPKADVYLFNTPVVPLFCGVKKSIVIALDFAYLRISSEGVLDFLKKRITKLVHKISLRVSSKIVAISRETKKETLQIFGISSSKVSVIYPGFTDICSLPSGEMPIPNKFFLFVGAVKERKNVHNIIEGFLKSEARDKGFKLVVAGSLKGRYGERVSKMVKYAQAEKDIIFTGFVSDERLSFLYKKAYALVFPSLVEGFGFPILEAFACGLPVITSAASSLSEVAGGAALLVNPSNVNEIRSAYDKLAESEKLPKKLSVLGKARAAEFNWRKTAEEFKKVITSLQ
ncbi:MAG: glycosyltransferase [bacterium]|nr:glycosyltransferase [bacterium]